jgi:hypothetical protein
MKKGIVLAWIAALFGGIGLLFWYQDWKYKLPTPVPENYNNINTGKKIELSFYRDDQKPVFLHFFNPRCPCSRFNMKHFKTLVRQYAGNVDFTIVVLSNKNYTEKEIQEKFDLDIPVRFDAALADSCGVYSTPQAVIIDKDHQLYYRGNYNKTRYCADKKSEYARIALDALLENTTIPFDPFLVKAYGCELPNCTKK